MAKRAGKNLKRTPFGVSIINWTEKETTLSDHEGRKEKQIKSNTVRDRLYVNYKLGDPDERRVSHQSKTRPKT